MVTDRASTGVSPDSTPPDAGPPRRWFRVITLVRAGRDEVAAFGTTPIAV